MEDFLSKILSMYGGNLSEKVEDIDIRTEAGYNRINEILDVAEKNPFALFFLSLAGLDLNDIRQFIKEQYEAAQQKDNCDCAEPYCQCKENETDEFEYRNEDEEEFYNEVEDEFDDPLSYSDKITPEQLRTINKLVNEFVGELEVNADEDFDNDERKQLSSLLREFASYVMLR